MEFKAGIGCKYPLFCDILSIILSVVFISLFLWFVVFLIRGHYQSKKTTNKKINKTKRKQ